MQVPGSANALMLGGAKDYTIARSLRFRSSATAYLTRTPGSAGNRKTFTISAWVKRGQVAETSAGAQASSLFGAGNTGNSPGFKFAFSDLVQGTNGCVISFQETVHNVSNQFVWYGNEKYRDPSAWYHIVAAFDTTQATASNRLKVWVNNQQLGAGNYPASLSQNQDLSWNNNVPQFVGASTTNVSPWLTYLDGYLAEVYSIDGQQLTPSSFGEYDLTTGVWKPKKYAGTYGTNGFYLNFSDNSAATAAAIGKDYSGNGNNFTPNNISVTAGVTYDSMTDVPTPNGASASNFCTLNSAIRPYPSADNITNGNLTFTSSSSGVSGSAWGTFTLTSGKWYFESTITTVGGSNACVGFSNSTSAAGLGTYTADARTWGWFYQADGQKAINNALSSYGATYTSGDVIGAAIDIDAGSITFYKNNVSQGTLTGLSLASGSGGWIPAVEGFNGTVQNVNFGQRPFAYTPPTGFVALNTFNLPAPSIKKPVSNFDVVTWAGDNSSPRSITNSGAFQPDFVWVKNRTTAGFWNVLFDSVRGAGNQLSSNETDAELASASNVAGKVSAFNSNGFAVSAGSSSSSSVNGTGGNYVGWQWKANGAAVSNTAGSITSQVSANASAGFSIVTYTGTGANATVGHGLGVAPKMIILKSRGGSGTNWVTYHAALGATQYIFLNLINAAATAATVFNNTAPTSSVFSLGSDGNANTSTRTHVAYCFSEVDGYSKFGSYIGNGSADGTFVHLGFRPKFVMYKCSSGLGGWLISDTARGTYNLNDPGLIANASDAEFTGNYIDILSNGFKHRATSGTGVNGSGQTYIYMAFAENPFKYSLAR